MKNNVIKLSLVGVFLISFLLPALGEGEAYRTLNSGKEGQEIEIKEHLVAGKLNIIDFYSEFCPPCKAIAPMLEELVTKDPGVVVGKVDINRPGGRGIDWNSPVAQQYKLRSIPYFKIYDAQGKLVSQGQEAKQQLIKMLEKNNIQ